MFVIGCSGSSAAMTACDGASRRAAAERTAKHERERVRALGARNAPWDRLEECVHSAERIVARALAAPPHALAVRDTAARRWRSESPNRGPPKATMPAG